jgi:hypothetical protein
VSGESKGVTYCEQGMQVVHGWGSVRVERVVTGERHPDAVARSIPEHARLPSSLLLRVRLPLGHTSQYVALVPHLSS